MVAGREASGDAEDEACKETHHIVTSISKSNGAQGIEDIKHLHSTQGLLSHVLSQYAYLRERPNIELQAQC